jgi:hypothetical protein
LLFRYLRPSFPIGHDHKEAKSKIGEFLPIWMMKHIQKFVDALTRGVATEDKVEEHLDEHVTSKYETSFVL